MIVGSGLLGRAFSTSKFDFSNFVVFSSGVSNSQEYDIREFNREFKLLKSVVEINPNKKLIYFSTCSIYENKSKPYTIHKKNTEDYIQNYVSDYLILRLPNIVGISSNPNQLTNFIFDKMSNGLDFTVFENVYRSLIDVDDIPLITKYLIESNIGNLLIDIAFNNGISMKNLIHVFEKALNIKAVVNFQSSDLLNYSVDNSLFLDIISEKYNGEEFNVLPENIINKYYKNRLFL